MKTLFALLLIAGSFSAQATEEPKNQNHVIQLNGPIQRVLIEKNVTLVISQQPKATQAQLKATPNDMAKVSWSIKRGQLTISASSTPVTVHLYTADLKDIQVSEGAEVKTLQPVHFPVLHILLDGDSKAAIRNTGRIRITSTDRTDYAVVNQHGKIEFIQ